MSDRTYPIRDIVHGKEARETILKGVDAVANAVKVTMGAKGRTVFTSQGHATKDGVTVARDVELFEDAGAQHGARLLKEASIRTCDKAGDGTTATCVLAQTLIQEGIKKIDAGKDPQDLKRELESYKDAVIASLMEQAKEVKDIEQIACISANDEVLGKIVAEAVNAVGADGLVTVEKTYGEAEVEIAEGMQIEKGLLKGPYLTDAVKRRADYSDVSVLLFNGKIHDLVSFGKAIEPLVKAGTPVLIIANDYDQPVERALQLTAVQGNGRFIPINPPAIYHDETFDDIAVYTGATVLTDADGLKNFDPKCLGHAKRVVSTTEKTTIQCDDDKLEAIEARVAQIQEEAKDFVEAEKRNVQKRASRLKGKVAIIRLPETTDIEGGEVRDRIEDAIFASQGALESGVVAGGGYAYVKASVDLEEYKKNDGLMVLHSALQACLKQIVNNAGFEDDIVLQTVLISKGVFNVVTGKVEALEDTKVLDPLKVAITAFENALSVALIALTTEVVLSNRDTNSYEN